MDTSSGRLAAATGSTILNIIWDHLVNLIKTVLCLLVDFFQGVLDCVGLNLSKKMVLNILHDVSGILKPAR